MICAPVRRDVGGTEAADDAVGAHRHEGGRVDGAVGQREGARASGAEGALEGEVEHRTDRSHVFPVFRMRSICRRCTRSCAPISLMRWARLSGPRSLCIPTRSISAGPSAPQDAEVRRAERTELRSGFVERHLRVAERPRPPVLVVALDRRPVLGEDHPHPEAEDELGIRQVLHDVGRRPLARRLGPPERAVRHARETAVEPGVELGHHLERIALPEDLEQRPHVGARRRPPRLALDWKRSRPPPGQRITIASPYE